VEEAKEKQENEFCKKMFKNILNYETYFEKKSFLKC